MRNKKVNPNLSKGNKSNMKKNSKLNSKLIFALSVAVIGVVLAICMVGCQNTNKENDFNTKINGIEQAKSVVSKITVVDGDVTVYDYTKTITIDGANAHVNEVEKSLGDNFAMVESVKENDIANIDKKSFCPINTTFFSAGMETTKLENKTVYSNKVSATTIRAFMTITNNVNVEGEGYLKLVSDNKNILSVELTYNTTTERTVTVTTTYSY